MVFPGWDEKRAPFLMEVDMAVVARDGGVAVFGTVKSGTIAVGDEIEIVGLSQTTKRAVVTAKDRVFQGEVQLAGVTRADMMRGQVLATPGTMKAYTTFWAQVIFSATQPRIDPQPFQGTFRSSFHIRFTDVYGTLWLPEGTSILAPGDQFEARIELQQPSALEAGLNFGIGRLMGRGTVLRLLD